MYLIFLDTETTGLNPEKHRMIEIAYRVVDSITGRKVLGYEAIIAQSMEVWANADPRSLEINRFTWEEILEGKTERAIAAEIVNDFNRLELGRRGGVFICQNPSFDRAFFLQLIDADLQQNLRWPYHWLDLASMFWTTQITKDSRLLMEMQEKDLSKDAIAAFYGIEAEKQPHRAMNGVNHLLTCYEAIFGKFGASSVSVANSISAA